MILVCDNCNNEFMAKILRKKEGKLYLYYFQCPKCKTIFEGYRSEH